MPASREYTRLPTSDDVAPFASSSAYPPPPPSRVQLQLSPPALGLGRAPDVSNSYSHSDTYSKADKGKGKARATPKHDDVGNDNDRVPPPLTFCVRFTDGTTDDILDLHVSPRETVRDVKKRLRLIRPASLHDDQHRPRRLRLIQLGRILVDGVLLVPYTLQLAQHRKKLELSTTGDDHGGGSIVGKVGTFVKEAVTRTSLDGRAADHGHEHDEQQDRIERGEELGDAEEQIWLHCSVGDVVDDDETQTNEIPSVEQQTTPLQGFDRLREAGFSEEDIESMRAEFRERRGVYTEPDDDDDAEHQRALEEQWMSGMTGQEEASGDSAGTGHYVTLLKGVCVGFFMPFLPLFFFRTQIFSRRMQMAIVLGILVNLGFGLLRLLG